MRGDIRFDMRTKKRLESEEVGRMRCKAIAAVTISKLFLIVLLLAEPNLHQLVKPACKKSTLTRNGSVAKLAIFNVRTRGARQRFQLKPLKGHLGLIRALEAKISDRSDTRAPICRVTTLADS